MSLVKRWVAGVLLLIASLTDAMALGVGTELVGGEIRNAGIYGAIISVLLSVILGLIAYVRTLHKNAIAVNVSRLAERDTMRDALNKSSAAILSQVEVSAERNRMTEELIRVINTSNAQANTLNALLKMQFEFIKDDHARLGQVVTMMSDNVKNNSNNLQAVHGSLQSIQTRVDGLYSRRQR